MGRRGIAWSGMGMAYLVLAPLITLQNLKNNSVVHIQKTNEKKRTSRRRLSPRSIRNGLFAASGGFCWRRSGRGSNDSGT